MSETQSMFNQHLPPLAERIRPGNINQFVGQEHLVGTEKILSMVMEKEAFFHDVLGPTRFRENYLSSNNR